MIDEKWEDNVFMMAKHKLLEAIENRKAFFTTKPDIPTVTFDVIVYSEDNSVTKKIYANITSELTSEEATAIKQFAKAQFTDKSNTN